MPTTLGQEAVLTELTSLLYDFLPASHAPTTFGLAAKKAGVEALWTASEGQSKSFRIRELLVLVLDQKRDRFPHLIKEIVSAAMSYRRAKKNPLRRDEVEQLNALLFELGFKIADLRSDAFLSRLAGSGGTAQPAASSVVEQPPPTAPPSVLAAARTAKLDGFRARFFELAGESDRPKAGRLLQTLLMDLFEFSNLAPESPFRVVGEELDGSFRFENEWYLLEAKWTQAPTQAKDLYVFHTKVTGKSDYTRGVFLSINGYSSEAVPAYKTGKAARITLLDGAHLMRVLMGNMSLETLLRKAMRHLVERGEPYLPVAELDDVKG